MENSASTRTSGTHMEFDENSGRTLSQPGPWYEVLKERKSQKTADENRIKGNSKANSAQNLKEETSGLTNPKMQPTTNQLQQQRRGDRRTRGGNNTPPRKRMLPPLPEDEYKVVYRPRTGLKLSSWSDKSLTQGIATAGGFPFKDFYSNVTIQTQWAQNLIIASTADEDYAMKLSMITQIQLGAALYELMPYLKPLPGTVRGVVHGIEAGTTEEELKELISVNGYSIPHARMLGKSSSALLTFEGPHVPFYVKAGSVFTRCRPHRRSVQYCRACGNVGHRQDVCPNPDTNRCNRCGAENPQDNHECQPKCKLCYQPHETASKECQKRLKPSPPPLHVRERSKSQTKQAAWTGVANDRPFEQQQRTSLPQDRVKTTKKKAKAREQALEQKLQQFIEQMQKQQQQLPQIPPRAPTPLPEDLEQKMEYHINKLDERIDQKIDQTMSQMTKAVEHKMNKMMETVNKVFENVNPTIIQMSTTLNAKIDRMGETLNAQMGKMGDELNQRISDLEKEREQARKKPKTSPGGDALTEETIRTHNGDLHQPDIIALQETETDTIKIRGYETHIAEGRNRTAILTKKHHTTQQHQISHRIEHTLIEMIPQKKTLQSLFILNVYSPPSDNLRDLDKFLREVKKVTKGQKILVVGDFNAPHVAWGYHKTNKKGTDEFDHYIIQTELRHNKTPLRTGQAKITDWTAFRKVEHPADMDDIEEWTRQVMEEVTKHTKTIQLTSDNPEVDPHLLHLWEARQGLLKRWKKQKRNRKLKVRIALLTREAEEYAEKLGIQNWNQQCDRLQGTLSKRKTWAILRSLLAKTESKKVTCQHIQRLIHNYQGSEEDVLEAITEKYIGNQQQQKTTITHLDYEGISNPELDQPFSRAEIVAALRNLTRNTTPGRDRVNNKTLRNLDDRATECLLKHINESWETGKIPACWKHADVTMIPKPGKPITVQNLRPISLTSCVGKLFEHMVHNRLSPYLEENEFLPNTMFGFRPLLSTQDILLQLKEDVIDNLSTQHKSAILALDIKGAFDNISHSAVLDSLQRTNCGQKTYNFVRDFLTDRTATIGLGNLRTEQIKAPQKGTPQGSVISPLLFNIAMRGLPLLLKDIKGLSHAIYADDLTIWTTSGSAGMQQDALQEAVNRTERYLKNCGLSCAPDKSQLLVLKKRARGRPPPETPDPVLTLHEDNIPQVDVLRVLGVVFQKDGAGIATVQKLQETVTQVTHLVKRVTNRNHGLKEQDTLRIIQALVISRITYGTPYLGLKNSEREKINTLIRKTYKLALGLSPTTSTEKLLRLGIHNTWEELAEAHKASQFERLKGKQDGQGLGYAIEDESRSKQRIPLQLRDNITVASIPRNMHPEHNKERRMARVRALRKTYERDDDRVRYTDAAKYKGKKAHAISVVNNKGEEIAAASVRTPDTDSAEETAIALAATTGKELLTVITDSQAACRNYQLGRISRLALETLKKNQDPPEIVIVWTPGHETLAGNLAAHAAAREHSLRATSLGDRAPADTDEGVPKRYTDILAHYRLGRRTYPPPHPTISREDAVTLRQLQTNTFPHGTLFHAMYPTQYDYDCKNCRVPNTLYHMVWE
ncbi:LOW QUALITY PROTEIN: uncharacterized protein LOC120850040, partial [Ixodes scapularis]|uniref:LOW QUALITY PROTEIN: uncharacterized protein LOC120850040 n=1 Tax=Ixodes scapularis TaxID=6945 RepID=UPI001A9EAEC7